MVSPNEQQSSLSPAQRFAQRFGALPWYEKLVVISAPFVLSGCVEAAAQAAESQNNNGEANIPPLTSTSIPDIDLPLPSHTTIPVQPSPTLEISPTPTDNITPTLSPEQQQRQLESKLGRLPAKLEVSDDVERLHGVIVCFTNDPAGDELSRETINAQEGMRRLLLNTFKFAATRPAEPVVLPKNEVVKELGEIVASSPDGLINGYDPLLGAVVKVVPWQEAVAEKYKIVEWTPSGAVPTAAVQLGAQDNQLEIRLSANFDAIRNQRFVCFGCSLTTGLLDALAYVVYPEAYELSVSRTNETQLIRDALTPAYTRWYISGNTFPLNALDLTAATSP